MEGDTKTQRQSGNMKKNLQGYKDNWHIKKKEAEIMKKQRNR